LFFQAIGSLFPAEAGEMSQLTQTLAATSLRTKRESGPFDSRGEYVLAAAAYLESLNQEQHRAVEHGVLENDRSPRSSLLVIAGAGSGKSNTLAHWVAHLIVNGADTR
jgi:UvrD/REP helicase N-terminal domain